jgi:concanavalin A-like lectin/glucanase superfamily protein
MAPPVAGYIAWWDATAITGVADAAALSSWTDSSGNGHTLTSTFNPTYYKTTSAKLVNGLPAVWFNGSNTSMTATVSSQVQPVTLIAVVSGATSLSSGPCLIATNAGSGDILAATNTVWFYNAGNGVVGGGPTPNSGTHQVAGVFNHAGASSLTVDGSTSTTADPGAIAPGPNCTIGATGGGGGFLNGALCEIIYYPFALSSTDIGSVASYLSPKWGTPAPPAVNGTATVALGPLTLTASGINIPTGVASLGLGPVTLAATGTVLALAPLAR